MSFQLALRRLALLAALGLACAIYLTGLNRMGLVGPDEPRYADIGRAMAQSGDWITPRLLGRPWFEKPALLYWMTAVGFRLGLSPELAPRLPVALLSLAFLAFFWWRLRLEWDARVASYATAMLATSAGWLTYSHIAVTDLPLAVFFSAAVFLALPWYTRARRILANNRIRRLPWPGRSRQGSRPNRSLFSRAGARMATFARLVRTGTCACVLDLRASLVYPLSDSQRNRISPRFLCPAAVCQIRLRGAAARSAVVVLLSDFLLLLYPWFPILALTPRGLAGPARDAGCGCWRS